MRPNTLNNNYVRIRKSGVSIITTRSCHTPKPESHDRRLSPSRRLIILVNEDPVFVAAQEKINLFPHCSYKHARRAGVKQARVATAFVLALYDQGHFQVTSQDEYDPSVTGQQERARNTLIHIIRAGCPLYLNQLERDSWFFDEFPEYREYREARL